MVTITRKRKDNMPVDPDVESTGKMNIGADCYGLPTLKFESSELPIEPPQNASLKQEYYLLKVEELLVLGVQSTTTIAERLEIDRTTAKGYKERIQYRWSQGGCQTRIKNFQRLAEARINYLRRQLWTCFDMTASGSQRLRTLQALFRLEKHELLVSGILLPGASSNPNQSIEQDEPGDMEEPTVTPEMQLHAYEALKAYLSD